MPNFVRKISISQRLMLLMLLTVIGIVAISAEMLLDARTVLLEQKQLKTRHVVDTAYSLVEYYADLASEGAMSEQAAQQAAASAVKKLRYEEKEYFWINDMQPRMVMHPYKPQLDGKDLSEIKDPNGKRLFVEFANTVRTDGAGFVDYMWPKPGQDEPAPKISYVKGFAPWQWIIGSGIYIDDVNAQVLAQLKRQTLIGLLITALIIGLSMFIGRGITGTMRRAQGVATSIANGNLDNSINVLTNDDAGRLFQAMKDMQTSLRERSEADRHATAEISRVKQALDNVSANVMVADAEHNIIYLNKTVERLFRDAQTDIRHDLPNFDADKLLGSNIDDFHKNPAHQRGLLARLTGTHHAEFNIGGRSLHFIANPIIDAAGDRIGTVVEWSDLTVERAIEDEVQSIVQSAMAGDLTRRIPVQGKQGFFAKLSNGINDLVDVNQRVVNDMLRVLGAMAGGDLNQTIDADYDGVFGQLKNDTNSTVAKLTEVISEVKTSSGEISTGAEEISQGNTNLSQRTEEQAATLEQTASSMEEMTATVKQNADNAAQANQLASGARGQAEQGGSVVSQAVAAMAEINQSSKKIADIIGVIDEIAFQTNLLALNAAVEAARAGDQGRGFAVVASEVRNLAQRSASAAKEIKGLIQDSVNKVEGGSKLVDESGRTLAEIVVSVKKVSDIIAEIAAAGHEQSLGIDQVNKAVTQMDEMTQQNAALVEQAAAASQSMSDQAHSMNDMMAFFQVGGSVPPVTIATQPCQERRAAARPWAEPPASTAMPAVPLQKAAGSNDDEWDEF